jgi:hypothetical protein
VTGKRKGVGQKVRFEVFKRDKFTCQYCGARAPEVVLHCDHIKPVADGGADDIINLLTACNKCNGGKGATPLSDAAAVDKMHDQLAELEERRQQLEMMMRWRDELQSLQGDTIDMIARRIDERTGWTPNESGLSNLRRWLKRSDPHELMRAVDEAFDIYLRFVDDKVTKDSWEMAFSKIPGVLSVMRQAEKKPYLRELFYIQGILRNRLKNKWLKCVEYLESVVEEGLSTEAITDLARRAETWEKFDADIDRAIAERHRESDRRAYDETHRADDEQSS